MTSLDITQVSTRLTPYDLSARQHEMIVLDVRSPGEFASAHIPGSFNVPLDLLPEHAHQLSGTVGGPLVLVCRSGMRALQAESTLSALDLPRLQVLEGGLSAWEQASLPVNRQRATWDMERQVRGLAGGMTLAGALAGLFVWRPIGGLAAAIGGGLLVSALTNSCTMARLLGRLPYNQVANCDVSAVLSSIRASTASQPGSYVLAPSERTLHS